MRFRFALPEDALLYFQWTNDPLVRQNSMNSAEKKYEDHLTWFYKKVSDPDVFMYLFLNQDEDGIGQVRIEKRGEWAHIDQSVATEYRGKKLSSDMLYTATEDFLEKFPDETIISVVKINNLASLKMAENSGFILYKIHDSDNVYLVMKGKKQKNPGYLEFAKEIFGLTDS